MHTFINKCIYITDYYIVRSFIFQLFSVFWFTVLPKFDPSISGIVHPYRYGDFLAVNCSSDWSNPAATLTWYINNKTAPLNSLQPQINEITRNIAGFMLYASSLQLRINIDDPRFITKSEILELKCVSDIMGITSVRREKKARVTILALRDAGHKQRLLGQGNNGDAANAGGSCVRIGTIHHYICWLCFLLFTCWSLQLPNCHWS
ncbi:unnamed protein product [Ceratitis capitata]|uniref:(Mediterranean fruit fly) hypothetical protein n=1 Tax=Ceratitis capitata TaxID=7213 RepID=A0A811U404_CERCA|nr:unnamed protein product [Ceratitis capitata]